MKFVERHYTAIRSITLGAGVYNAGGNTTVTVNSFPITLTNLALAAYAYDLTTGQAIGINVSAICATLADRDNPGITSIFTTFGAIAGSQVQSTFKLWKSLSPSEAFTFSTQIYLQTVTANSIIASAFFHISYLCPEDYLSLEAFAASPE